VHIRVSFLSVKSEEVRDKLGSISLIGLHIFYLEHTSCPDKIERYLPIYLQLYLGLTISWTVVKLLGCNGQLAGV